MTLADINLDEIRERNAERKLLGEDSQVTRDMDCLSNFVDVLWDQLRTITKVASLTTEITEDIQKRQKGEDIVSLWHERIRARLPQK